jgi:phosphoglucomutase
MILHPMAGHPAKPEMLIDPAKLEYEYYATRPNVDDPRRLVISDNSGHRGTPLDASFNEAHILAITPGICDFRRVNRNLGPLFMGKDTHALSGPAERTALEVLAANQVETVIQENDGITPTPAISRAILVYNRANKQCQADGIVITPSHNPPEDGGFKYNQPHGGPADSTVTSWIQGRANVLLSEGVANVRLMPFKEFRGSVIRTYDFMSAYVKDLGNVLDIEAIRASGLKVGVDPRWNKG